MADESSDDLWLGWSGHIAHPNSPAGGRGPGAFRMHSAYGTDSNSAGMLPHPGSPVGRHFIPGLCERSRLFAQRRRRRVSPSSGGVIAVPPSAVVTRIIVVTSGDDMRVPVQGSNPGRTVEQQHIWDHLARQLAGEPAPENGRTLILHPADVTALENQFRAIARHGGRVARIDWVGHGSDSSTHHEGFHLYGVRSGSEQWVSPDDMVRIIADSGVTNSVSAFETHVWACYSDVWVDRVANGLQSRGVPNPRVVGQIGDFNPRYGPRSGHPGVPERDWVVDPTGPTRTSGQPQPTVRPDELRGL
jgi:hypothetical protein